MTEQGARGGLLPLGERLAGVELWGRQRHLLALTRRWPDLVGRVFAEQSCPAWFRKNELWVYVRGPLWMQQMQFCKPEILAKINALLQEDGRTDDLRWALMPADFLPPGNDRPPPPAASPDPAADQAFQAMAEAAVANPEARAALRRLWLQMGAVALRKA